MIILTLNTLLYDYNVLIGASMSIDRWIQQTNPLALADKTLDAPINTLIAIGIILALIIVIGVGVLLWKMIPFFIKQVQQQYEANLKLTEIAAQNSTQTQSMTQALVNLGTKTDNQTVTVQAAIEKQTAVISIQNQDQKNYQTLVSDNLSDHGEKIAENTENIKKIYEQLGTLETSVNELPEKWSKNLLESRTIAIESIKGMIDGLRQEVTIMVGKQQNGDLKRSTGSLTAAVVARPDKS